MNSSAPNKKGISDIGAVLSRIHSSILDSPPSSSFNPSLIRGESRYVFPEPPVERFD